MARGRNLVFRKLEEKDYPQLSELHRRIFGVERENNFWEWKYSSNPGGIILSTVVLKEGRIVGEIGAVPVRFKVQDRIRIASQEVDILVDEEYKKGGTFLRLVKLRERLSLEGNLYFSYAFTVPKTLRIATKLLKFREIAPAPKLVKIMDLEQVILSKWKNKFLARAGNLAGKPFLNIPRFPRKISLPQGMRIEEVKRFDRRFDHLWEKVASDYSLWAVRDSKYLNWRYIDIPVVKYKVFSLEKGEEVRGFIVLHTATHKFKRGYIIDILTPREDYLTGMVLVKKALEYFRGEKVALVISWMLPHTHIYKILRKFGFFRRETTGRTLAVRAVCAPESFLNWVQNSANWYITQGDCDDF